MPRRAASGRVFRPPSLPSIQGRSPDPSVDALRPCTAHLQSLPIVNDGDPNAKQDECPWADDFRDDVPQLEVHVAEPTPAVMAEDVKVVLFDCNILIVSEMCSYLDIRSLKDLVGSGWTTTGSPYQDLSSIKALIFGEGAARSVCGIRNSPCTRGTNQISCCYNA
jgi:hypothetical protein